MINHKRGDDFDGRTYLLIRYATGDGGTRPIPNNVPFWQSPDVVIVKPDNTTGGEAVADALNHIEVLVTNLGGIIAVNAYVDAFLCDPTTGFTPATAFPIGGGFLTVPGYGNVTISLPWTPTSFDAGHRCVMARVSLVIPPDTYQDGTIFDVINDRHIAQRNIHVVTLGGQKKVMFPFVVPNAGKNKQDFLVVARELREPNEIAMLARTIGWGFMRIGATPLKAVNFAPIRPIDPKMPDDGAAVAAGAAGRLWFNPAKLEPTARLAPQLKLSIGANDVIPLVAVIERNEKTGPGEVHALTVQQVDGKNRTVGGFTIVVVH